MKRIILFLTVISLLVGVLASCKNKETSADILRDDLSAYVEIDPKYYKGYTVVSNINVLVGNEIIKSLYKHKSAEPVEGDGIISVGDSVSIFYKGYYLNGDTKVYFNGGSNMGQAAYSLGIGSGGFIPGFEYNMIGKNPAEYSESNPMVIETYFPSQYQQSPELAGKTAWFEVYVEMKDGKYNMTEYSVPELDAAFITETLGISETTLASYNGATLVDRYYDYTKKNYISTSGFSTDTLAQNAFWESVMNGAVVKAYPTKQLKETMSDIKDNLIQTYENSYYTSYYTLEEFICLYLGYDQDANSDEVLEITAKDSLKQQMIFYQIMNQEGLKPNAEQYDERFDEYLEQALASNGVTSGSFASHDEYLAEKEKFKQSIIEENGEEYFMSMIYYEIGIEAIIDYANIEEIPRKI